MNDTVVISGTWAAVAAIAICTITIASAVKRIYSPPCPTEDALTICAQSAETRSSAFCMELAKNSGKQP